MGPEGHGQSGRTRQAEAVAHVRAFVGCGHMVAAWLGRLAERRIEPAAAHQLREAAGRLTARHG